MFRTIFRCDPEKVVCRRNCQKIEYIIAEKPNEPPADMSVREFIEEVASRSSAPGGGSVSAMQAGLKTAINVPLKTMRLGDSVWNTLLEVARYGNPASKSDIQVGARSLETGLWGAYQNVLINITEIEDMSYLKATLTETEKIMSRARKKCSQILEILENNSIFWEDKCKYHLY